MTARESWKRARGYARASKAWATAWAAAHDRWPGLSPWNSDRRRSATAQASAHERHAWGRLPAKARAAVQP